MLKDLVCFVLRTKHRATIEPQYIKLRRQIEADAAAVCHPAPQPRIASAARSTAVARGERGAARRGTRVPKRQQAPCGPTRLLFSSRLGRECGGRLRHWPWRPQKLVIGCEPNAVGVSQGGEPKRFHVFRGGSPSPTVRAERVDWVIATMPAEAVERLESCGAAEWLRVSGVCLPCCTGGSRGD